MKCVICKGIDIERRLVDEEIKTGSDVVLIPVEVMVCKTCGERYYGRKAMRYLEEIEAKILEGKISFEPIGRVLKVKTA